MNKIKSLAARALPLSLGLALSIVLIARICFDLSFDGFYTDAGRIYAIHCGYSDQGEQHEYSGTSGGVAPGFRQYVPGVEEATRFTTLFDSYKYFTDDKITVEADGNLIATDTSFFKIFDRKILIGNSVEVLNMEGQAMVSESFAEKLGGADKAIGKTLYNYEMPEIGFTVCGVFEDFPKNGSFDFDILVSINNIAAWSTENWLGNDRYYGYVKLAPGVSASALTDAIYLMQKKNQPLEEMEKRGSKLWYYLEPFDQLHTDDRDVRNSMVLFALITVLLLSISVLNYLLSVVSAVVERSRAFATRKCFGAEAKNIYAVLFREALLVITVSLALAVLLLLAAEPLIRNIMGIGLDAMLVPMSYVVIAVVLLLVLLFTAVIPGAIYMRVPVIAVLKKYTDTKRRWKYALLVLQFTINVFLFGMLLVVVAQYGKVMRDDPGYDYENVLYFYSAGIPSEKMNTCMDVVSGISGVQAVSRCSTLPFDPSSGNNVLLPGSDRMLFNISDQYHGTQGFFKFFDILVLEGREPLASNEVAVSRNFVEKMKDYADWSDGAVGKQIIVTEHSQNISTDAAFTISGVYEDYLIGSFNYRDERPSVRFSGDGGQAYFNYFLVKVDDLTPEIMEQVRKALADVLAADREVDLLSYEEQMHALYAENRKMRDTFMVGCLFSLLISIFGLVGYIGNEAARRSKEIAIRKINGARAADIVVMFVADSLKMAAVAIIVGDILLYLAAVRYLEQFPDHIALSPAYFVVADLILLLVVIVAVVFNSIKISMANPVESIKNE